VVDRELGDRVGVDVLGECFDGRVQCEGGVVGGVELDDQSVRLWGWLGCGRGGSECEDCGCGECTF